MVALIRRVYGDNSQQESDFNLTVDITPRTIITNRSPPYEQLQQSRLKSQFPQMKGYADSLVQDLESRSQTSVQPTAKARGTQLRIFIAHDGPSTTRDNLERFLRGLGAEPLIVELSPGADKSPGRKVDLYLSDSDFGIVLARKSRGVEQDGKRLPRANVIDEMARLQGVLDDRRMLLLESGLSLPSNASEWTYETFIPQSMDRAFIAIATELNGHRLLYVRGLDEE